MNEKRLVIAGRIALIIALAMLLSKQTLVNAEYKEGYQKCHINIYKKGPSAEQGLRLNFQTLWSTEFTTVIWDNKTQTDEIKITFENGEKCQAGTENPIGFTLDEEGRYVTDWLSPDGSASLFFRDKGTYKYVVETKSGEKVEAEIFLPPTSIVE